MFIVVLIQALIFFILLYDFIFNDYPLAQKEIHDTKDLDEENRIKGRIYIGIVRLVGFAAVIILTFYLLLDHGTF